MTMMMLGFMLYQAKITSVAGCCFFQLFEYKFIMTNRFFLCNYFIRFARFVVVSLLLSTACIVDNNSVCAFL